MFHPTEDIRIQWTKVVLPRSFLRKSFLSLKLLRPPSTTPATRSSILNGHDDRLLVLAGPCSIHDVKAAREYAGLLKGAIAEFAADLRIVMRVYFEKPRTTIGWKGLINDPHLDGTYKINDGLRLARHLLIDLAKWACPREPSSST
jgi:3-deoxy-7-phosphoheptulonate synthase